MTRTGLWLMVVVLAATSAFAQTAPRSPNRPWTAPDERQARGESWRSPAFHVDPTKTYTLPELIDLAQHHNPDTRVAWEQASARAAALGIARSELYPMLTAAAVARANRSEVLVGNAFIPEDVRTAALAFDLTYMVFDFGGRAGRIDVARAETLAANFTFNDTHRKIIFQVSDAYYRLLNAAGQEDAARASLANAQAVQRAADDRLQNGLATLPDVLEARGAAAQADYELQAALGAKQLALRSRLRQWQPQLRMLFLTRSALLKYRLNLPGFELPDSICAAQETFDHVLARRLDTIADRVAGIASDGALDRAVAQLEEAIREDRVRERRESSARLEPFLALSRRIEHLTIALDRQIERPTPQAN